jgi:hypothetical protein
MLHKQFRAEILAKWYGRSRGLVKEKARPGTGPDKAAIIEKIPLTGEEEASMSLVKTWYTAADAAAKFGVEKSLVLSWVDAGLVRCERDGGKVARVNIDDVRLEIDALVQAGGKG